MKVLVFVFAAVLAARNTFAQGIFEGNSGKSVTLADSMVGLTAGDIVIIGENHGFATHQSQQLEIMKEVRKRGFPVQVGMEFFYYPDQFAVDQWRSGNLSEADFLKAINWGSPSFDYYREQALFSNYTMGLKTYALNAPRSLTSKVAKVGIEGLSEAEAALLPPQFELGRATYRDRFLALMPHLPNPAAGERYFAAQSIWDDTMAYNALKAVSERPDAVLVIVVGEFHVQYGGGLPDRIKARGYTGKVWTWTQLNTQDLSQDEVLQEMAPSKVEGPRADYIWAELAQP